MTLNKSHMKRALCLQNNELFYHLYHIKSFKSVEISFKQIVK